MPPVLGVISRKSWAAGLVGSKCFKAKVSTETASAALTMHSCPPRSLFSLSENVPIELAPWGIRSRLLFLGQHVLFRCKTADVRKEGRKEERERASRCHPASASCRPDLLSSRPCDILPDYCLGNRFQSEAWHISSFLFEGTALDTRQPNITAAPCESWMNHSKPQRAFCWLLNCDFSVKFFPDWFLLMLAC